MTSYPPAGAVLRYPANGTLWRSDGEKLVLLVPEPRTAWYLHDTSDTLELLWSPPEPQRTYRVGDEVSSVADYEALPYLAAVVTPDGAVWQKVGDLGSGRWEQADGDLDDMADRDMAVSTRPDTIIYLPPVE